MIFHRYLPSLLLAFFFLPLHAQLEEERIFDDNDTLLLDSLPADTVVDTLKHLPWPQNVQEAIGKLLRDDMFQTSQVGLMVWDLDADSAIFRFNERQLLRPASVMKVVTAIAALDRLGGSYRFKTELCYTGRVDSCTLNGDVYCVGGFDPRFNIDDMHAFAEALHKLGIDTIRGNIYADKSMKDNNILGEGWCWDDDNPLLSPLLFSGKDEFLQRFYTELRKLGIYLDGGLRQGRKPEEAHCIVRRFHTMDQILMRMLKESDNLYAEALFYQIAASTGNRPATAKDARSVIKQLVRKLGMRESAYKFADGCGLSLYNYVSAELMVRLLRYAHDNQNIYNHLLPALPVAGRDGTLRRRMSSSFTRGNVRAKTGTVAGISSLCGYLTAGNGHNICFCIINQGVMHGKNGRRFQNRLCSILCQPQ